MRKIYLLLLTVCFAAMANGQIGVTVTGNTNTTPNLLATYPSLAAAITDLNLVTSMTGPVVFDLAAGSTESVASQLTITAAGDPAFSITFQKSGAGANPLVSRTDAGSNATSTLGGLGDGIIRIEGTDNIIFDGLDLAASDQGIEYGYYTHKTSGTNACQGFTIRNCNITMTKGTSAYVIGIYIGNGTTSVSSATGVTVSANSGRTENVTITGNTISNVHAGIVNRGSNVAGFFDQNFVIGQSGAGNTIQNFGGGAAASTYGVYFIYVNNPTVAYNTINNAGGGGSAHASGLWGIFYSNVSGDVVGSNNAITMNSSGTSAVYWIQQGNTCTSNTFNNNTFAGSIAATSTSYMLNASSATNIVTATGNVTSGTILKTGASGLLYGYYNFGSPTGGTATVTNNNFSNVTLSGSSGFTGIRQQTAAAQGATVSGNTVSNITTTTGTFIGIEYAYSAGSVNDNTITGISGGGAVSCITAGNSSTVGTQNVYNNIINTVSSSGASLVTGIQSLASGTGNISNVYQNKICDLSGSNAGSTVFGITVTAGKTTNVFNNLIGNLTGPNATGTDAIRGISVTNTTTTSDNNISFNTIYLNATGAGNFGSSGIYHTTSTTATTSNLVLRSNIIYNISTPAGTGITAAYRRSSTTLTNFGAASNNNLFYAGTPGAATLIFYDGTNSDQTLSAYKTRVSSRDASSVTEDLTTAPTFLSTTCGSSNFLHISTSVATQIESGGTTVAGITTDFDGNVRNVTTPDIGADEGTFTLADFTPPSITYTPLTFTCATGSRTLTASITDASGVPTAGAGLPVLYWRINAGAWTAATGVFVSGSNYDFTFGSGVVTGDLVEYYIVAQDNAGTPNVGASPSTGAAGFTANPPAAATAPTTPSSYSISNILSGTYTVGAAGTYTTLTAAINAYNTSCLGGPVVFSLIDASYTTTSDTIRANAYASAVNTLTIKPAATGTTITGNTTSATIVLFGADYVTIDGSVSSTANTVCPASSASRDLTISNTNAGTSSAVVSMNATAGGDAPTNNTVKNCIITGNTNTTTLVGINNSGTGMASGAGSNFNNNNAIVNNSISRAVLGIFSAGSGVATKNSGTIINQNEMTGTGANSIGRFGIMVLLEDNLTVSGNTVSGTVSAASADAGGICIGANGGFSTTTMSGGEVTNATITNNVIGVVQQTNTFSASGIAVLTGTTGTMLVANNMLSGVNANGTTGDFATGIFVTGGTGSTINVHYNSVTMTGTLTGADEASYAFAILSSSPTVNVRNNIFISTGSTGANRNRATGLGFALPAANLVSDNNNLFVSGTGAVVAQTTTLDNTGGVNHTALLDWQTNASQDANSKNVQPTFVSATNLHLVTPDAINFANLESMGTAVSVTNDIDCQARPNGSAPDIGADEFVGAAPSCNVPTAVSVGSITTTSASVSFTCTGCTGTYIVEYGAPGFVPGTGGSAGGGTIVTGAASPIAIGPLTAATTYDVYVRQDCGAGSYSNNSTVVTFTTLCNTFTLPYTENFDGVTPPAVPNCSLVENVNGSTTWATAALNPNSAPNSLTYSYNTPLPGDDWWYTPGFNLTGGTSYRLTFSYRARSSSFPEALEVKYGNGQNAGAMTSPAIFSNTSIINTTYSQATIDFTPGSSGVYYIGFHNISLADQFDLHVDDIGFDVTPACPAPAQPTMSAITSNSATATWAGAASYILEYGPTGYTPGTGATAGAGGTLIDPAVSPQAITGLSGTTTYDLYVRQVCAGPSWSANSPVRTFTTLAAPPPNDEASGAILLTVGAGCTGATYTNVAATASANEPYPSCSGTKQSPVWFSFVAPASGAVRVSTDVGSGPTFTDSKLGLFSGTDLVGYTDFQIISCDDDGGSAVGSFMSVVYATGLTPGTTYYIAADRYSSFTSNGTFCIAVDELNNSHLSTVTTCTTGQTPVSNSSTTYTGWAPLMDNSSRLIALVRNTAGGDVSLYSIAQNINAAAVRSASGVYYLDRNYRINNSSATNVDVQFFYLNSELTALAVANPSTTAANLGASRQSGTTCQADYSVVNGTPTFLAQTGNGVSTDGLVRWIQVTTPSFSNFYLQSSVGGTLPTGLLTFSGQKEGSVNKLRWTTSSEQNNSGFEVQRSTDGITYTAIGFVNSQAMGGNSSDALNYSFVDMNPVGDRQYYRLRQVDLDNRSKLSNIVLIKGNKPVTLAIGGLFPNPANSQINVILDAPVRDKVTLVVMDATGKSVIQKLVNVETGSNTIPVNISTLTNGTYLVKLVCSSNCESATAKFVKQ